MGAAKMSVLPRTGADEMMASLDVDAAEESLQIVEVA